MSTTTVLIDLHYLPSLTYFACLVPYHTIRLEAQESYQKQTYRNRCYILTSQKVDRLTVPVKQGNSKVPYTNIEIDYSQPWADTHWRTICTAYGKAPYFEYFSEYFRVVFVRRYTYLFDLNLALLQTCLRLLQLERKIELSEYYEKLSVEHTIDARYRIHPSTRLRQSTYGPQVQYQQVFDKTFHSNLSILDLLFCSGHNACTILRQTISNQQQLMIP